MNSEDPKTSSVHVNPLVLVNGRLEDRVDWLDRGFQYGDGVFTTVLVRAGRPMLLDRHLARLGRDCERVRIPFCCGREIGCEVAQLCRLGPEGILKIQITRGPGGRGYRLPDFPRPTRIVSLHPLPRYDPGFPDSGVRVRICANRLGWNSALAGVKHANRLEQILARAEWSDDLIQEGLMLDQGGILVEGTMSNVFLVHEGRLATPRLDRCGVEGVMRALVLEIASQQGIGVEEGRLYPDDLKRADEIFLTNSIIGLWPVSCVENTSFSVGPLTRRLACLVRERLMQEALV